MIDLIGRSVSEAWPLMRARLRLYLILAAVGAVLGLLGSFIPAPDDESVPVRVQLAVQTPNLLGFIALWFVLGSVIRTERPDFRMTLGKGLGLIGFGLIVGICVELGMFLLIVPGVFIAVKWSQVVWCWLADNGRNPLGESWELTKGHFWTTLGYSLLVGLAAAVALLGYVVPALVGAFVPFVAVITVPLAFLGYVYALHVAYLSSFRWTEYLRANPAPTALAPAGA